MRHLLKISIGIFLIIISLGVKAQKTPMKGRVVETHSGEPIPFTNIGVQGTFFGVATDENGYFAIDVPNEYLQKTLAVSAIGYHNKTFVVSELAGKDVVRITLNKETYSFDAVDVTGQSLVAFRVVSDAIKRIPQNYYAKAFGLDFHYLDKTQVGASEPRIREAVVEMTDKTGYADPEVENAYRNRKYRYAQVNKNFTPYSFPDALPAFDALLSFDIVRMGSSVLNSGLVSSFDLQVDGMSTYEGDSVWVISYQKNKPTIAHSGDFFASHIAGKLYILKGSYALVRHEFKIEAPKNNPNDRSLFTDGKAQTNVTYQVTCVYQPFGAKFLMSYVSEDKQYVDAAGQKIIHSAKASMLNLKEGIPMFENRNYYEDVSFDKNYWQKFRQK
ncbi:MAG: carboxypeptidase-like regulatory domain-containing protein [Mangrovibacterium sp.]